MEKVGLLARIVAKAGKEEIVENFLKSALNMAQAEEKTIRWYAFKLDKKTFGIFDTFAGEDGRNAHLGGDIAKALMDNAPELLSEDPIIEKTELLAVK